jgi:hypothetical protein
MPRRKLILHPLPILYRGKTYQTYEAALKAARLPNTPENRQLMSQLQNQRHNTRLLVVGGRIEKINLTTDVRLLKDIAPKLSNKQLIQGGTLKKGSYIVEGISGNKTVTVSVTVKFFVIFSPPTPETMSTQFAFTGKMDDLDERIDEEEAAYVPANGNIVNREITVTTLEGLPLDYDPTTHRLRKENVALKNWFNGLADIDDEVDPNCVKAYLKTIYPSMSKKKINSLGTADGVTPAELHDFCVLQGIKSICYDITGKVLLQHIPDKISTYKSLNYVAYDGHIYPLKHRVLQQRRPLLDGDPIPHDQLITLFDETLKTALPADIRLNHDNLPVSFTHDDKLYFANPEFYKVRSALAAFAIQDQQTPLMTMTGAVMAIVKLYKKEDDSSFLPMSVGRGHFTYNIEPDPTRPTITVDKNKCYSDILQNRLFMLMKTDIRTARRIPVTNEIVFNYLYIVTPLKHSILIPNRDIYTGKMLLKAVNEGIDFVIEEALECYSVPNHYREAIQKIYEVISPADAKVLVNRLIGTFATQRTHTPHHFEMITTNIEKHPNTIAYKNDIGFGVNIDQYHYNITNQLPVSIQIKDEAVILLYDEMKRLKLSDKDIVQVNADSFTYYKDATVIKPKNQPNLMESWKLATYHPHASNTYDRPSLLISFENHLPNENFLGTGFAGCGKSTRIRNLIKKRKNSYLIVSSTHAALAAYKQDGYNTEVIQTYGYNHTPLPKATDIYVEECFLCSKSDWNVIVVLARAGKNIFAFGDPNQCPPVGETRQLDAPMFRDYLFKHQQEFPDNWRNTFTIDYYKSLIAEQDNSLELIKYSKPWETADIIICYTNETIDIYNEKKLNHLGKKFGDADTRLVCISNDLRDDGIYNGFFFTVTDNNGTTFTLDNDITLPLSKLSKFRAGYARTVYGVQGNEYRSFHIAQEDYHILKKNKVAYTVISRLKTEARRGT